MLWYQNWAAEAENLLLQNAVDKKKRKANTKEKWNLFAWEDFILLHIANVNDGQRVAFEWHRKMFCIQYNNSFSLSLSPALPQLAFVRQKNLCITAISNSLAFLLKTKLKTLLTNWLKERAYFIWTPVVHWFIYFPGYPWIYDENIAMQICREIVSHSLWIQMTCKNNRIHCASRLRKFMYYSYPFHGRNFNRTIAWSIVAINVFYVKCGCSMTQENL